MFVTYKDIDGDSNVECYEIGAELLLSNFMAAKESMFILIN